MLFLSPLFLWGLLAASIPVIIHLINRRRHQTIQWAAMQFLLKATRESRGKRKLRNILILTCRCLILAGIVTAAARPVISGLIGWGGGSIDTVILLLDRSASMELKAGDGMASRRQLITDKVRDAMGDLGNPRLVLIDSASLQPQEVPSPDVLSDLSSAAATDTAADIPAMLNRAAEWLRDSSGTTEVWLASDLQATNWRSVDEGWATARASLAAIPNSPRLRVLSLTGPSAANASIRLLNVRRAGDELRLTLELQRFGDRRSSVSLPLVTHLNGISTTESLTITEQSLQFQKGIKLSGDDDSGFGWVSIPGDGNERDNVAFFAYGKSRDRTTLVVSARGESADYLSLAAAPAGFAGIAVKAVTPDLATVELTPDLAAVLWAAPLPTGSDAEALKQFVASGGQLMLLPPGVENQDEFLGVKWSPVQEAAADKFFILEDWNRSDGLWRDGIDGTALAGNRLKAIRRQIPLGADLTRIARWEDGEPALSRRIYERGTLWCLSSIPDYTWSNLGDADMLLPAVQRMVEAGADRFDQAYQARVGPGSERLLAATEQRRVDDYGSTDRANGLHEAGVYNLGDHLLALNRPEIEDVPDMLTQEELLGLLDGLRYSMFDQTGQEEDSSLSQDVWRAFLIAAMLFLIGEALLCLPKKTHPVVLPGRTSP